MNFNKTSASFYKKGPNKASIDNKTTIMPYKSRNNEDIMQYYSLSSAHKNSAASTFNSYYPLVETKNIHNSFRKDIRNYREKRKKEIDNFYSTNLNSEYYCKNFHVNNSRNSSNELASIKVKKGGSNSYDNKLQNLLDANNNNNNNKNYNSNQSKIYYNSTENRNYKNADNI